MNSEQTNLSAHRSPAPILVREPHLGWAQFPHNDPVGEAHYNRCGVIVSYAHRSPAPILVREAHLRWAQWTHNDPVREAHYNRCSVIVSLRSSLTRVHPGARGARRMGAVDTQCSKPEVGPHCP